MIGQIDQTGTLHADYWLLINGRHGCRGQERRQGFSHEKTRKRPRGCRHMRWASRRGQKERRRQTRMVILSMPNRARSSREGGNRVSLIQKGKVALRANERVLSIKGLASVSLTLPLSNMAQRVSPCFRLQPVSRHLRLNHDVWPPAAPAARPRPAHARRTEDSDKHPPILHVGLQTRVVHFSSPLTTPYTAPAGAVDILHPGILITRPCYIVSVGVGCSSCHDGRTLLYVRWHVWRSARSPKSPLESSGRPAGFCTGILATA